MVVTLAVQALFFRSFGGPEVLEYGEVPDPATGPGEALVRTTTIGLNFADIYRRRGNYHLEGGPPYIAGYEAAGVIESPGRGAPAWMKRGTRVAFADSPFANAELVSVQHEKLIPLPDDVSDDAAAALLLQGLTALVLCTDSYRVRADDTAVVHAAAGGVGLLLVQMLKAKGARVISFASSDVKRRAALAAGADEAYGYEQWPQTAHGSDVVFDSVGTTLSESIESVRTGGTIVFYGFAGGNPPRIDPRVLMDGSKHVVGADLWNVLTSHHERVERSKELFEHVRRGRLNPRIARTFALEEGATLTVCLNRERRSGRFCSNPKVLRANEERLKILGLRHRRMNRMVGRVRVALEDLHAAAGIFCRTKDGALQRGGSKMVRTRRRYEQTSGFERVQGQPVQTLVLLLPRRHVFPAFNKRWRIDDHDIETPALADELFENVHRVTARSFYPYIVDQRIFLRAVQRNFGVSDTPRSPLRSGQRESPRTDIRVHIQHGLPRTYRCKRERLSR